MQRFRYKARNIDGRNMSGEVVAISREEVASRLQEAGVYVLSIKPIRWSKSFLRFGRGYIPQEDLLVFLESWAMFLEAGISIQSSLLRLRMRSRVPALAKGIEDMMFAIDSGATVGEALKASQLLPSAWVSIVQMGEISGNYTEPLKMLYRDCLDFQKFKREILYHLIMPFVLLIVMGVWFWILFKRVIPSLVILMESTGGTVKVPVWMTAFLSWVMSSVQWLVPAAGLVLLCFCLWVRQISQQGGLSQLWVPHWMPVLGPLVKQLQLIIVAKNLQMQLEAGIPFANAIESITEGVKNEGVRRDLLQLYRKLREGVPIPEAVSGFQLFSQMGQSLLVAGHESGKMPEMMGCLVRESESVLIETIKRLTIFIQMTVVISCGITVGAVVIMFFSILFGAVGSFANSGVLDR